LAGAMFVGGYLSKKEGDVTHLVITLLLLLANVAILAHVLSDVIGLMTH